jgi:hypothetical protein
LRKTITNQRSQRGSQNQRRRAHENRNENCLRRTHGSIIANGVSRGSG